MSDYSKAKRRIQAIDDRIIKHKTYVKISLDNDETPLSTEVFSFSEIKNDVSQLLKARYRASMKAVNFKQTDVDII